MYTIDFAGLFYFNACSVGRRAVYAPDGTKGDYGIHEHAAGFYITPESLDSDDWWTDQKKKIDCDSTSGTAEVWEFLLPARATIVVPCDDEHFDATNLDTALAQLQVMDPGFKLEPGGAIAVLPVNCGTLETYQLGAAAVVRWTIKTHKGVFIEATVGTETKRITLKENGRTPVEIVFANLPEDIIPKPQHEQKEDHGHVHSAKSHFALYGKLNKNGPSKFEKPYIPDPSNLPKVPTGHPFLIALSKMAAAQKRFPPPDCTPTCC